MLDAASITPAARPRIPDRRDHLIRVEAGSPLKPRSGCASLAETSWCTALTAVNLQHWLIRRCGKRSPATWNARLAAARVLIGYCQRQGWLKRDPTTSLERRRAPRDETRAIPFEALDTLWTRADIGLREKALWRMLYATAARASEVLALDVEDLDVGRKRAAISGKGGHREIIVWDAATARLLPRYLAGRRRGPLFVTAGLPNVVPAELDRSPDGRGAAVLPAGVVFVP